MPTQTFAVTKMYRPGWPILAAIAVVLFGGVLSSVFHVPQSSVVFPTCVAAGTVGSWVLVAAMSTERLRSVSVVDGVVVASWLRVPIRPSEVRIGSWVQMSLDASVGLVAHVRGPGGSLRIGARRPVGGYRLDGPRAQLVNCHLPAADFDVLVGALGVRPGLVPEDMTFELAEPRRGLRTMAPWGITGILAAAAAVGLSALAIPQTAIIAVLMSIVITGLLATMLDSWRIREPENELRIGPGGFALARSRGRPERVRAAWPEVRAVPATDLVSDRLAGTHVYPSLEITLGLTTTIVVGARDSSLAWTNSMERQMRKPQWLVGSAEWPRLVQALESHGCFR